MSKLYVVVLLTKTDDDFNVNVMGGSTSKEKAEALAARQEKYAAPSQIIDIFETEEL